MCCVSTRGLSEQLADFRGVSKRISFIGNNNGPSACAHRAANYNPIYLLQKLVLPCANPLCRHALGSLASAFKALQKQICSISIVYAVFFPWLLCLYPAFWPCRFPELSSSPNSVDLTEFFSLLPNATSHCVSVHLYHTI